MVPFLQYRSFTVPFAEIPFEISLLAVLFFVIILLHDDDYPLAVVSSYLIDQSQSFEVVYKSFV